MGKSIITENFHLLIFHFQSEKREMLKKKVAKAIKAKGKHEVFVSALNSSMTEHMLKEHFSKYGEVKRITLPRAPGKKNSGYAFVAFTHDEAAQKALEDEHKAS